ASFLLVAAAAFAASRLAARATSKRSPGGRDPEGTAGADGIPAPAGRPAGPAEEPEAPQRTLAGSR
ncbi:hypothetical protein HER39_17190, partial [Arthrobacter deserti]|nr:hypothetical protein [Arthrobacter deserti]